MGTFPSAIFADIKSCSPEVVIEIMCWIETIRSFWAEKANFLSQNSVESCHWADAKKWTKYSLGVWFLLLWTTHEVIHCISTKYHRLSYTSDWCICSHYSVDAILFWSKINRAVEEYN